MFKNFLRSLVIDIKDIFKEEQVKIEVWNNPQRVSKIKKTEIWVVEGSKEHCPAKFHDSIDNFGIYIRAKYNDGWYMVNKHGCPVGAPYSEKTTDKWKLVKRIG